MTKSEANKILRKTLRYLSGVTSSSYAPFTKTDLTLDTYLDSDTNEETSAPLGLTPITGAMPALLPMTIATSNITSNKRVEFTMLVNPENVNHGKTNSVYSSYTRNGYVTQLWGPNQDLLTGTGKSAAFMVEGAGLTNILRRQSIGFQNFMALLRAYRNNGYMMLDPMNLRTIVTTRVISLIHGIEITYDGQVFMGHFNNFTIDENAETPFTFNYNFEFVCSTLSNNYNGVRGHFKRISISNSQPSKEIQPVLLADIIATEEDESFFGKIIDFLDPENSGEQ